jgi:serine/threonine protein kinase
LTRLGPYKLIKAIATGGMGEVFLAQPDDGTALVAVKRVLPVFSDHPEILGMFLDEARIVTALDHPNIARATALLYDEGGTPFLVMEYVPGKDLQRICQHGVEVGPFLPMRLACRIISLAAAGLHHAHTRRDEEGRPLHIVHRDISPPNILVSFNGDVKVVDFGIARADNNHALTEGDEHFRGKFGYMSPEQCLGVGLDQRSDVFALGILLYEITAKTRLFRAKDPVKARELIVERDVPAPTMVQEDYPVELERIVLRALAREKEARFQTAADLHQALEIYLREHAGGAVRSREIAAYMQSLFQDSVSTVLPTYPQIPLPSELPSEEPIRNPDAELDQGPFSEVELDFESALGDGLVPPSQDLVVVDALSVVADVVEEPSVVADVVEEPQQEQVESETTKTPTNPDPSTDAPHSVSGDPARERQVKAHTQRVDLEADFEDEDLYEVRLRRRRTLRVIGYVVIALGAMAGAFYYLITTLTANQ